VKEIAAPANAACRDQSRDHEMSWRRRGADASQGIARIGRSAKGSARDDEPGAHPAFLPSMVKRAPYRLAPRPGADAHAQVVQQGRGLEVKRRFDQEARDVVANRVSAGRHGRHRDVAVGAHTRCGR